MTLTNLSNFPPGGYKFFQPQINWKMPDEIAMLGLSFAVEALQTARAQNPWSNLDPTYEVCLNDIADYTCKRLKSEHPYEVWSKFCSDDGEGPPVAPGAKPYTGCAHCGGRK